jgi:hypothetical protein
MEKFDHIIVKLWHNEEFNAKFLLVPTLQYNYLSLIEKEPRSCQFPLLTIPSEKNFVSIRFILNLFLQRTSCDYFYTYFTVMQLMIDNE